MIKRAIAITACLAILTTGCAAPKNYSPIRTFDRIEDIDIAMKRNGVMSLSEIKLGLQQARTYNYTPGRDAAREGFSTAVGLSVFGLEKIGLATPMAPAMSAAAGYLTIMSAVQTALALAAYQKNTLQAHIKLSKIVEVRRSRNKQFADLLSTIIDATMSAQEKEEFLKPLRVCPWLYFLDGIIEPLNVQSYIYASGQEDLGGGKMGSAASSTMGNKVILTLRYGLEMKGRSQDDNMCGSAAAEKYCGDMIAVVAGQYKKPPTQPPGPQNATGDSKAFLPSNKQEPHEQHREANMARDAVTTTAIVPTTTTTETHNSPERFVVFGDIVLDTETKLMWPLRDNGKDLNWREAEQYCKDFRGGGHTDWRMPTQSELQSLYDRTAPPQTVQCHAPLNVLIAASPISISCPWIWSSETKGEQAGGFLFDRGVKAWMHQYSTYGSRVIPVRATVK